MSDGIRRPWTPFYGVLYLPVGIPQGFVSVTLGYELRHQGVSVAAIAGIVSLSLLPWTWKVLSGPMVDLTLTPRKWHMLCVCMGAVTLCALGLMAGRHPPLALLGFLGLVSGITTVLVSTSICNIIGAVEPENGRGVIGGFAQAGNLGGLGMGGGAGLWLTGHAGGLGVASIVLSSVCFLSIVPLATVRAPPPLKTGTVPAQMRNLLREVWAMARSRTGALALLLNLLPMGLGASNSLWASVAGDWHASADVVALITGALGGLASVPGSLFASFLCRRLQSRSVYFISASLSAALLVVMAVAPHTQASFAFFTLTSAFTLGATWGSLSSVTYECIGRASAATKAALILSVSNVPVVAGIAFVGSMQTRYGSNIMLYSEAGLAALGLIAYLAIALMTARPVAETAQAPVADENGYLAGAALD